MKVTFFGVSTLLFQDEQSAIMTDGFFSRPGLLRSLFLPIAPNRTVIRAALDRAGVASLNAVLVAHSHYDHALDSAIVAQMTGAPLVGSSSVAKIAEGYGLHPDQFHLATLNAPAEYGGFTVTVLPAQHSPRARFPGRIDRALHPPARIVAFAQGECYSFHIRHRDGSLLIHASANFLPGALDGCKADTVYLGIGTLGKQTAAFRNAYWRELVVATGAKRVIAIHWDNFWKPLSKPLTPLPRFADNFLVSKTFLEGRGRDDGVEVTFPAAWQTRDPFEP